MSFLTKKILAALFLPVPIVILLCLIGIGILLFTQHQWLGKSFILVSIFILLAFSTPFLPRLMLKSLEGRYQPLTTLTPVKKIVVLGAGNGGYSNYPANNKLSSASMARLIEGIRIHKLIPHSTLILSGGRVFGSPSDSSIMNNVASMLGIQPSQIDIEAGSQDTFEEAVNLKKLIGSAPFILVTSAYHMPRAMALFERQAMHPIAAPTQLILGSKRYSIKQYLPNSSYLLYSDIAIHEYLGLLWSKLSGKI